MLNTLDTVIAFAVIMTVLSLLITILVQMVSGALSLRGKNLANALALTFQTIDPALKKEAHSLAAQILRDPIFSDSILKKKDRVVKDINAATRALMVAERNFADAEKSLKEAEQSLAEKKRENGAADTAAEQKAIEEAKKTRDVAKQELEKASADPTVSVPPVEPNRLGPWGFLTLGGTILGSAIRPGEIYRILHEFAGMTKTEAAVYDVPPELTNTSAAVLKALQKSDQPAEESHKKLEVIASMADLFDAEAKKAVVDSLTNFGASVERATTQAYDRFQRWFGSAQDRAEQWFQMHVRIVTIVAAIVTAFLLQLDTGDIYRQLRDQPKLVEALVKSAPGFVEQGGKILDPTDTSAYHAYLFWLEKHPSFELKPLPAGGTAKAYHDALEVLLKEKSVKPEDTAAWLTEYDELQTKGGEAFLQSRQKSVATLKDDIEKTGFALVPAGFIARWDDPQRPSGFCSRLGQFWPHLFGVFVTAGLLTLGAPFWFNLLKNLMSLRPAVANLIEKRPTSAPALPTTPATPPSSS